jgi:uncharacterized OB-fold protein
MPARPAWDVGAAIVRTRRRDVPKQSPAVEEWDRPFWEACNEDRLVLQNCTDCDRLQHPPQATCGKCGSKDHLEWKAATGRGKIVAYVVVYDTAVTLLALDQPFNCACVELEDDPQLNMLSHLPGVPVDQVPVGAKVQVIFETTTATGQKVPEWQVVS